MLELACPHCGNEMQIPEQYAGHRGRCQVCGGRVFVSKEGTIAPYINPDEPESHVAAPEKEPYVAPPNPEPEPEAEAESEPHIATPEPPVFPASASGTLSTECPFCQIAVGLRLGDLGTMVACPHCNNSFEAPAASVEATEQKPPSPVANAFAYWSNIALWKRAVGCTFVIFMTLYVWYQRDYMDSVVEAYKEPWKDLTSQPPRRSTPNTAPSRTVKSTPASTREWINPNELKRRHAYAVSKQTPLMPEFKPQGIDNTLNAIGRMKHLRPGQVFSVGEIRLKGNTPWYYVLATVDGEARMWWINATALYGQDLVFKGKVD